MKIDCGFGVSLTPQTRTENGLQYFDYKIENSEVNR